MGAWERDQHAIQRAWERYGMEVDSATLRLMEKQCRDGKAMTLAEFPDSIVYEIDMSGTIVRIYIGRRSGRIATFLPRRAGVPLSDDFTIYQNRHRKNRANNQPRLYRNR